MDIDPKPRLPELDLLMDIGIEGSAMPDGERPISLYRREVLWARPEPELPLLEVWHSFNVEDWDRWIDELSAMEHDGDVVAVQLFAGQLSWGQNMSGQMLRIIKRHRQTK